MNSHFVYETKKKLKQCIAGSIDQSICLLVLNLMHVCNRNENKNKNKSKHTHEHKLNVGHTTHILAADGHAQCNAVTIWLAYRALNSIT